MRSKPSPPLYFQNLFCHALPMAEALCQSFSCGCTAQILTSSCALKSVAFKSIMDPVPTPSISRRFLGFTMPIPRDIFCGLWILYCKQVKNGISCDYANNPRWADSTITKMSDCQDQTRTMQSRAGNNILMFTGQNNEKTFMRYFIPLLALWAIAR